MTPAEDFEEVAKAIGQTLAGAVFVLAGFIVMGVALAPAIYAAYTHGPHTDVSLTLLCIGIGVSFFGAALWPSMLPVVGKALRTVTKAALAFVPTKKVEP